MSSLGTQTNTHIGVTQPFPLAFSQLQTIYGNRQEKQKTNYFRNDDI